MPSLDLTVSCPVFDSFRVQQVAGMFDVPVADRAAERFQLDIPDDAWASDWRIGLIIGPSGSGKTTIARQLFGERLYERQEWPRNRAVIDCLGDRPIREITGLLTAVGLSSPPAWVKPYRVLSAGEQFRCDLARALSAGPHPAMSNQLKNGPVAAPPHPGPLPEGEGELVAFDEFTSVVNREVARTAALAMSKSIRQRRIGCRFVAITCHDDVEAWLQPDWTIDMATSTFQRRCLPRPAIELELFPCSRDAWPVFAGHHYLTGELNRAVRCYVAVHHRPLAPRADSRLADSVQEQRRSSSPLTLALSRHHEVVVERGPDGDESPHSKVPVAFCATIPHIGQPGFHRISRLVVLPDYQGIGIGTRLMGAVAELHAAEGHRVGITASHPAILAHCRKSPRWRQVRVRRTGSRAAGPFRDYRGSPGRAVVSFEYVGQAFQPDMEAATKKGT